MTPERWHRHASARLGAYAVVAVGGLFGAVMAGRPELVALAAPAALLAIAGVVLAERPELDITLHVDVDRVLEGDDLTGELVVDGVGRTPRLDVLLDMQGPVTVIEPSGRVLGWSVPAGHGRTGPLRLAFGVAAGRWGVARLGPVHVRAHGPLGLVRWEARIACQRTVRVLPPVATLRRLLEPAEARAAAGAHLTRRRADGVEFAEVRPYAPGDRLRAVNWPVSSRRGGLWVNQRHPERSADVVLLVDTFADGPDGSSPALERAVQGAWMVAAAHLRAHDRVGVVAFGGYPAWLPPAGGDRARYALLDRLLTSQAAFTEAQRSVRTLPRGVIPAGAAVVAFTPLHDLRVLDALVELRRRGLTVAVVEVDVGDTYALAEADEAAGRLWAMERARRRDLLSVAGANVVVWPAGQDAAGVVDALARTRRGAA